MYVLICWVCWTVLVHVVCVCVCSIVGKIGLLGLLRCLPYTCEFWLSERFLLLVTDDASFVCSFFCHTTFTNFAVCRIMSVLCAFSRASIKNGPALVWLRPNFVGCLLCNLHMYVGWHSVCMLHSVYCVQYSSLHSVSFVHVITYSLFLTFLQSLPTQFIPRTTLFRTWSSTVTALILDEGRQFHSRTMSCILTVSLQATFNGILNLLNI